MARQVRSDSARLTLTIGDFVPEWVRRGGPGSGHFEHAGIPGHRGGSLPGEAGQAGEESRSERGGRVNAESMVAHIGAIKVTAADSDGVLDALHQNRNLHSTKTEQNEWVARGVEVWIAPSGEVFDVQRSNGHARVASLALSNHYATRVDDFTPYLKLRPFTDEELMLVANRPPSDRPFYNHLTIDIPGRGPMDLSMSRPGKEGGLEWMWGLDLPIGQTPMDAAPIDVMKLDPSRMLGELWYPDDPDHNSEAIMAAHGFIRISRGGMSGSKSVGIQWDASLPPTKAQQDVLSAAVAPIEADEDASLVYETVNNSAAHPGADGIARFEDDYREFWNAVEGKAAVARSLAVRSAMPAWALKFLIRRGGPTSGHYGHAGIPGHRGGSLPGEAASDESRRLAAEPQPAAAAKFTSDDIFDRIKTSMQYQAEGNKKYGVKSPDEVVEGLRSGGYWHIWVTPDGEGIRVVDHAFAGNRVRIDMKKAVYEEGMPRTTDVDRIITASDDYQAMYSLGMVRLSAYAARAGALPSIGVTVAGGDFPAPTRGQAEYISDLYFRLKDADWSVDSASGGVVGAWLLVDFETAAPKLGLPLRSAPDQSAYLYIPLISEDAVSAMATEIGRWLNRYAIEGMAVPSERLHCTLLYLEAISEEQIQRMFEGLALPLKFRCEVTGLARMGDAIVALLDPDPALLRLQRDLWMAAKHVGATIGGFSNPTDYKPHISLAYDLPPLLRLDDLNMDPAMFTHGEKLDVACSAFAIGREDQDGLRTIVLPSHAGDRLFVIQGGVGIQPHITKGRPMVELTQDQWKTVMRGQPVYLPGTRRLITRADGPFRVRGGEGSGHYGHAGIPGHQGGSLAGEAGQTAEEGQTNQPREGTPGETKWNAIVSENMRTAPRLTVEEAAAGKEVSWWLTPEGEFVDVRKEFTRGQRTHDDVAAMLLGGEQEAVGAASEMGVKASSGMSRVYPGDVMLQGMRWIRGGFRSPPSGNLRIMFADVYHHPTDAQTDAIKTVYMLGRPTDFEMQNTQKGEMSRNLRDIEWAFGEMPDLVAIERGGPTSGHYGHAGIPGHRGGSLPGEAGQAGEEAQASAMVNVNAGVMDRILGGAVKTTGEDTAAIEDLFERHQMLIGSDAIQSGTEFWLAPSGKAYNVENFGGHAPAATRHLVQHYAERISEDPGIVEDGIRTEVNEGYNSPDTPAHDILWKSEDGKTTIHMGTVIGRGGDYWKLERGYFFMGNSEVENGMADDKRALEAFAGFSSKSEAYIMDTVRAALPYAIAYERMNRAATETSNSETILSSLGFVRVSRGGNRGGSSAGISWDASMPPTQEQKDVLSEVVARVQGESGELLWETVNQTNKNFGAEGIGSSPDDIDRFWKAIDGNYAAALGSRSVPSALAMRFFIQRGGPGSGHYGHAGIPGHQGGSLPSGVAGKFETEEQGVKAAEAEGWTRNRNIQGANLHYQSPRIHVGEKDGQAVWRQQQARLRYDSVDGYHWEVSEEKHAIGATAEEAFGVTGTVVAFEPEKQPAAPRASSGRPSSRKTSGGAPAGYRYRPASGGLSLTNPLSGARAGFSAAMSPQGAKGKPWKVSDMAGGTIRSDGGEQEEDAAEDIATAVLRYVRELLGVERGGEGSGHRGHQGIPGHRGGSLPSEGGPKEPVKKPRAPRKPPEAKPVPAAKPAPAPTPAPKPTTPTHTGTRPKPASAPIVKRKDLSLSAARREVSSMAEAYARWRFENKGQTWAVFRDEIRSQRPWGLPTLETEIVLAIEYKYKEMGKDIETDLTAEQLDQMIADFMDKAAQSPFDALVRAEETKMAKEQYQPGESRLLSDLAAVPNPPRFDPVRAGFEAVDSVHMVPDFTNRILHPTPELQLPILETTRGDRYGVYISLGSKAVSMRFNLGMPEEHAEMTTAHEAGHLVDHLALGNPSGDSGTRILGPIANYGANVDEGRMRTALGGDLATDDDMQRAANLREVMQAVTTTPSYEGLRAFATGPSTVTRGGKDYEVYVDRAFLSQASKPSELFARAYSQYISVRSGNANMRTQLSGFQAESKAGGVPLQWQEDEFKPVAAALDKLFGDAGWLKK